MRPSAAMTAVVTAAATVAAAMWANVAPTFVTAVRVPPPPEPGDEGADPPEPTWQIVSGWASAGCSDREIADRFDVPVADVRRRFARVLRIARARRAFTIRKAQTDHVLGEKPNATLMIWLGRNELGQSVNGGGAGEDEPDLGEKVG